VIGQAVRGTGGQVPVVPFIWPFTGSKPMYNSYYENGTHITNGSTHASAALIRAMIEMTYEAGGAAALFWVDEVTEDTEREKERKTPRLSCPLQAGVLAMKSHS
jgi:hypothetical protein